MKKERESLRGDVHLKREGRMERVRVMVKCGKRK